MIFVYIFWFNKKYTHLIQTSNDIFLLMETYLNIHIHNWSQNTNAVQKSKDFFKIYFQ